SDSVWWWRWEAIGRFHGWLAPTMDPYPATKEIIADTQILHAGLGRLLVEAEMQDDGVGMLYSLPSAYATRLPQAPTYGSYEQEHIAWHRAIRELGLNFRYVTDGQLRSGEADLSRFKILILPFTQAMSVEEAASLRDWVAAGGVLVADVRPAIFDGRCKLRSTGALDDVFGVSRTGLADARTLDGTLVGALAETPLEGTFSRLRVDGGITAAGAVALGSAEDTPLFLVHPFGHGQAVLLNFSLSSYPSLSAPTTPESAAVAIETLFRLAKVHPAWRWTDAQGNRLRHVEITRWRNGDQEIVSLFRPSGPGGEARVELPSLSHVYELKTSRYLGRMKSFDLSITPSRAQFFVTTPKTLKGAQVQIVQPRVEPGGVIRAKVRFPDAAGSQVARLVVRQPDGQMVESLSRILVGGSEKTEMRIPVAFNDPPGRWTVEVTELIGCRTEIQAFQVTEAK
ncbi:MAG: beta-galactosidase trimerization domain-containing protein, partial [Kiritimatiellia bacterium]|nr:beta-galactosidase trimerization domain-containing protein [Kiritimatiellia bacterium]